jgi:stearoyl-CoA desaturase (delta-9 desaturase)
MKNQIISFLNRPNWLFIFQLICHVALVFLIATGEWWQWAIAFGVYAVTGSVGASATLHRLLSHRSYTAPKWWEYFGTVIGTLGGVGSSIAWVAIHREHHRYVDTPRDPHSPLYKGFFRVQFLIMFNQPSLRMVADLMRSEFHAFMHNYYWAVHAVYAAILYAIDPMAVIYAHLVPALMLFHAGGFINTFGHFLGWQDHPSKDTSVNNPLLGIFVWGEGWHNNHHANPGDWRFGQKWWQIDVAGYLIRMVRYKD